MLNNTQDRSDTVSYIFHPYLRDLLLKFGEIYWKCSNSVNFWARRKCHIRAQCAPPQIVPSSPTPYVPTPMGWLVLYEQEFHKVYIFIQTISPHTKIWIAIPEYHFTQPSNNLEDVMICFCDGTPTTILSLITLTV